MIEKIQKTEEEWKKLLTTEQYRVLREKGTESPYSCAWKNKNLGEGIFYCAACGLPLFESKTKFESGTGWPSFFDPVAPEHIEELIDTSLGMKRVEVRCARCGSHLGHVFDQSRVEKQIKASRPMQTGKRYCINSLALDFRKSNK